MTKTPIRKPKNLAELKRYLQVNPYLRFHHPGGFLPGQGATIQPRKFVRASNRCLDFETGDGLISELRVESAKDFEFFEDRFEVRFPFTWGPDLMPWTDKRMVYFYLSEPCQPGTEENHA